MGIFSRCQITLELDSCVNFKKKAALKKKIIDNDGIVSFIVTKKVFNVLHYLGLSLLLTACNVIYLLLYECVYADASLMGDFLYTF